jgi:PAS domain-containing protein
MIDENGRHIGFARVTRDLTESRIAHDALRISEQYHRLLLESVVDYAIFTLDPEGPGDKLELRCSACQRLY